MLKAIQNLAKTFEELDLALPHIRLADFKSGERLCKELDGLTIIRGANSPHCLDARIHGMSVSWPAPTQPIVSAYAWLASRDRSL